MFPGGEGAPNMQELLKQAQQMQQDYVAAQQELVESEVSASSGGGLVTVTVTGAGEFRGIKIDPKAVDPEDVETLEDLVGAAVLAAGEEAKKLAEAKLGPVTQALQAMGGGGALPGM
ncbi:YbaB/EbfC family nucleoid-associated protein [Stackebrandtia nassauensis]|uniref:Nucleoid-associated protein Snas_6147 n=1 Tax=Stackebrandtia nassauensis (strain DSM 44728 / CIP 108903 / NRRL B-16338 / NBRC 102104 / LLR-40K-21) TaxID=446470 RepID=D3Q2L9_STANL|nr:YbaB/EbfC family nucleoid-associated protein [Stackebrandtia nassauensis]ADD45770.1 conserved hypothetical protein [Stackebrandtia nassauensis DSM 44728]